MAPSTVGTFLRTFTFGHVRQLEAVLSRTLADAWGLGAGPGDAPLVVDLDSTICEVHGKQKQGAAYACVELTIRDLKEGAVPTGEGTPPTVRSAAIPRCGVLPERVTCRRTARSHRRRRTP